MTSKHIIKWADSGREPQHEPNPNFPHGIDINAYPRARFACKVDLPYPAKRIGFYAVRCTECGRSAACTTAGRADDPRSVVIPCNVKGNKHDGR